MKPRGFYKLANTYPKLVRMLNGKYEDTKERPIYCCIQDKRYPGIFWAIPTSDLSHRTAQQIDRITKYTSLPERDIRSCYYHIGHTNKAAIFKVSNALPVSDKYIEDEYFSNGRHLILKDKKLVEALEKKLYRILQAEKNHPNKFEQRITDVFNYLIAENASLQQEKKKDKVQENLDALFGVQTVRMPEEDDEFCP